MKFSYAAPILKHSAPPPPGPNWGSAPEVACSSCGLDHIIFLKEKRKVFIYHFQCWKTFDFFRLLKDKFAMFDENIESFRCSCSLSP